MVGSLCAYVHGYMSAYARQLCACLVVCMSTIAGIAGIYTRDLQYVTACCSALQCVAVCCECVPKCAVVCVDWCAARC